MAGRWGRWPMGIGATLLGLGTLAGGALGGYYALIQRPQPRARGVCVLPELSAAAEVVRDAWGIPHIRAASLADAYAAQGFVHAQDRLWQLELNRRAASGRLAELFGARALEADRFLRRVGLRRAAERELAQMAPEPLALLVAYCRGVNAGIAAASVLPLEFRVLRTRPEPWTPLDSLAYAKLLSFSLTDNWELEMLRARLLARLGPELATRLEPRYPSDHPLAAAPEAEVAVAELLRAYEQAAPHIHLLAPGASNSWAVRSARTATGAPLLATDPHLGHQMPAVWHEAHLTTPNGNVAGGSLIGLPGVVVGHNGRLAWGLTAAPVDCQDLYLERFDPEDATRYEVNGEWRAARIIGEVIHVRGQAAPEIEHVRVTRHGPLLTPLPHTAAALALRWVSHEPDHLIETIIDVNRASTWEEARVAFRQMTGLPLNVVCADADDTIAYQLVGRVPIRPGGGGLLPVPGWTDDHEWRGVIPFEEMPSLVNPPSGVVVSANNAPVGADYPYYLGHDWSNGYRARRIADLLASRERHTLSDFARLQLDVLSLPALRLTARMADLPVGTLSLDARHAFDLLRAWDGHMRAESAGAAVYGRLMPTLLRRIFQPSLGDILNEYLGKSQNGITAINFWLGRAVPLALDLLDDPEVGGLPLQAPPGQGGVSRADSLLLAALEETVADLQRLLGSDPATWRWGAVHRVTWRHPLGQIKALAPLFNRGPYELPGDADTVNYCATLPLAPAGDAERAWLAGYRLIVDLADPGRSVSLLTSGQSGLPLSPHYADQIGSWRSGRPHSLLYERTAVDRAAIDRLILMPG